MGRARNKHKTAITRRGKTKFDLFTKPRTTDGVRYPVETSTVEDRKPKLERG